jgi:hypothetical protein
MDSYIGLPQGGGANNFQGVNIFPKTASIYTKSAFSKFQIQKIIINYQWKLGGGTRIGEISEITNGRFCGVIFLRRVKDMKLSDMTRKCFAPLFYKINEIFVPLKLNLQNV